MSVSTRTSKSRFALILSITVLLFVGLLHPSPARAQSGPSPDGTSSFTAAASCWEIKQNDPTAGDGVYWLLTPTLGAPEQFYCDMSTDGGGWVLVGRGREGWVTNYDGLGTSEQVRETVNGPAAFQPRQLASRVIDGLLDGGPVDALTDGIRLRRATTADGTSWQEARFNFAKRDRWVWTFAAEHRVGTYSFDGVAGSGGMTSSFGSNNAFRRVDSRETSAQNWQHGWAYGGNVTGTTGSSTYLWSSINGLGFARPFTQVFLRPQLRLADLDFDVIPDSGTAEEELTPLLENGVLPGEWGVTGLANGQVSELAPEVSAFAQVGDTIYVGGNFRYVQRGSAGADRTEQPYLAAFDVDTGAWLSGFRPQLNQQVKSLAALPDGTLMVGGEFTQANGQAAVGAVRLNPSTGATSSGWSLSIENRIGGGRDVNVRAMDVQGNWLYLGGLFTHVGGGSSDPVYARMATRVLIATGIPDANWNPDLGGSVIDMDASADGSRVYVSGYFETAGNDAAENVAALNTIDGSVVSPAWTPTWSALKSYQQGILEVGGRVWSGGSEHNLFSFDRDTFDRLSGNITKLGGDFQAIESTQGVVYAGCHCDDFTYSNAFTWSNVGTNWTQADRINHMGAWDAATGDYIPDFGPTMRGRAGYGPWAIFADNRGQVWVGGDLVSAARGNGPTQWVGGFARYDHRDVTAPTRPTNLSQTGLDETNLSLTWGASSDDSGAVTYELLQDDRVVTSTSQTSLTVPAPMKSARYFVRAVDETGNRSASTDVLQVTPVPAGSTEQLVATKSSWRWQYVDAPWPEGWTTIGFDDSSWAQGSAVLGFGSETISTNIDVAGPTSSRPLSAQFRHSFQVDDASALSGVTVTTVADDGVVVYVNGAEVGRERMPTGPLTSSTWASSAIRTSGAGSVTFTVPPSLLRDGVNVVSASTHLNYRGTADISFDLSMIGQR